MEISSFESALATYIGTLLNVSVSAGSIVSGSPSGYALKVENARSTGFLDPPAYNCTFYAKTAREADCVRICDILRSHLPLFGISVGTFNLFYLSSEGDCVTEQGNDMGALCYLGKLTLTAVVKP